MKRATLSLLIAGLMLLSGGVSQPEPHRYRIEYWDSQDFDFSVLGQPARNFGFGYTTWLQVALAESLPELRRFTMTVDSARLTQGSIVPLPVDSLQGASWTGLLRPDGRLLAWTAGKDRPGAGHLRTLLWHFYPRVTRDLRVGAEWTDTVERRFAEINGSVTFTITTHYRAEAADTIAGRVAYRIVGDIEWNQAADLQFTRGMGSMNGSGRGWGRYHLAADDRTYLAGESVIVSTLILSQPSIRDVPIHDSSYTRVVLDR